MILVFTSNDIDQLLIVSKIVSRYKLFPYFEAVATNHSRANSYPFNPKPKILPVDFPET